MAEAIRKYTEEEESFINGIEFAKDYQLPIPETDLIRYWKLTESNL